MLLSYSARSAMKQSELTVFREGQQLEEERRRRRRRDDVTKRP